MESTQFFHRILKHILVLFMQHSATLCPKIVGASTELELCGWVVLGESLENEGV